MKKDILLLCVDEAHVCLPSEWGKKGMREDMYVAPSYLRAQVASTTEAPVIAMTASARTKVSRRKDKSEVEQIKVMCSIQFSKTTTIVISPVLNNHNYVVLKKPSVVQGFYGENRYSFSHDQIGSANILWRIYLEKFVSDVKNGNVPKRAVLYVKTLDDLGEIDDFLTMQLGHLAVARTPNT